MEYFLPAFRKASFVLLTLLVTATSAAPIVGFQGTGIQVNANSAFKVDIYLSDTSDLYAMQLDLSFTPNLLAATSTVEGPFFSTGGGFVPGSIDNSAGLIQFIGNSILGASPGISGSGVIISAFFQGLRTGVADISISDAIFLSSDLTDIAVDLGQPIQINILPSSTQIPEPSTILLALVALSALIAANSRRNISGQFWGVIAHDSSLLPHRGNSKLSGLPPPC